MAHTGSADRGMGYLRKRFKRALETHPWRLLKAFQHHLIRLTSRVLPIILRTGRRSGLRVEELRLLL